MPNINYMLSYSAYVHQLFSAGTGESNPQNAHKSHDDSRIWTEGTGFLSKLKPQCKFTVFIQNIACWNKKKKTRLKVAVAYKTVFLYDPLYDSSIRD